MNNSNSVRYMQAVMIFALSFILLSCSGSHNQNAEIPDENHYVRLDYPQKQWHEEKIELSGTLKPWREANLGTSLPGRVEKIHYTTGEFVAKGSLIAELSAEPAIMAMAEYETLHTDMQRMTNLLNKGSITQQEFDHMQAKYKAAKARYDLMKKNTNVIAPFNGQIIDIMVNEGETFSFQPGMERGLSHAPGIIRFMQTNPLKITVDLPEKYIPMVDSIQKIWIYPSALSGMKFPATITRLRPLVSENKRTAELEMQINERDKNLMPGMFAKVELVMKGRENIFIPAHALQGDESGNDFVWVASGDTIARQVAVQILDYHEGLVAIRGIKPDQKVILSGFAGLEESKIVSPLKNKKK